MRDIQNRMPKLCKIHDLTFPGFSQPTVSISKFFNASKDGDKSGLQKKSEFLQKSQTLSKSGDDFVQSGSNDVKGRVDLSKLKERLLNRLNQSSTNLSQAEKFSSNQMIGNQNEIGLPLEKQILRTNQNESLLLNQSQDQSLLPNQSQNQSLLQNQNQNQGWPTNQSQNQSGNQENEVRKAWNQSQNQSLLPNQSLLANQSQNQSGNQGNEVRKAWKPVFHRKPISYGNVTKSQNSEESNQNDNTKISQNKSKVPFKPIFGKNELPKATNQQSILLNNDQNFSALNQIKSKSQESNLSKPVFKPSFGKSLTNSPIDKSQQINETNQINSEIQGETDASPKIVPNFSKPAPMKPTFGKPIAMKTNFGKPSFAKPKLPKSTPKNAKKPTKSSTKGNPNASKSKPMSFNMPKTISETMKLSIPNIEKPTFSQMDSMTQNQNVDSGIYSQSPSQLNQKSFGTSQNPFETNQNPFGTSQNPFGSNQNPFGSSQNSCGSIESSSESNQNPSVLIPNPLDTSQNMPIPSRKLIPSHLNELSNTRSIENHQNPMDDQQNFFDSVMKKVRSTSNDYQNPQNSATTKTLSPNFVDYLINNMSNGRSENQLFPSQPEPMGKPAPNFVDVLSQNQSEQNSQWRSEVSSEFFFLI